MFFFCFHHVGGLYLFYAIMFFFGRHDEKVNYVRRYAFSIIERKLKEIKKKREREREREKG